MVRINDNKNRPAPQQQQETLRANAAEVEIWARKYGVDLTAYFVLRIELTGPGAQMAKIQKTFQEQFQDAQLCFLTTDKRNGYVVLCYAAINTPTHVHRLEELTGALVGRTASLGVSMQGAGADCLPTAFYQADVALEKSFYQPAVGVYFFYAETCSVTDLNRDTAELFAPFSEALLQGEAEQCAALLEELFHDQHTKLRPREVRREGIALFDLCMRELDRLGIACERMESVVRCQDQLLDCASFSLYCTLMRALLKECSQAVAQKIKLGGDTVLDARNFIENNYNRPISASDVAEAVNVNPGYLSRIFKNKTGLNMVDMINRKKVAVAKELLSRGHMKINEVAGAVGVADMAYFSHLFRKYTGMSPRDYQKWCLHGEKEDN